jgi:hypothetical protein
LFPDGWFAYGTVAWKVTFQSLYLFCASIFFERYS